MGWFTDFVVDVQQRSAERRLNREYEEQKRRREEEYRRAQEKYERQQERIRRDEERRREENARKLTALKSDTEYSARELSAYKNSTVNPQLTNWSLKNSPAMKADIDAMDLDVRGRINSQINAEESSQTDGLKRDIAEIDRLLEELSRIKMEAVA